MLHLLAFIAIWYGLKSALECILQEYKNSSKIAGNITSIINGSLMILSPIIMLGFEEIFNCGVLALEILIQLNAAYNAVDFVNASITYKIHHVGVFICDYLILTQQSFQIQLWLMITYSMVELSNIFVWSYYHKIQAYNFKPSTYDIKIQLAWFASFRGLALCLAVIGWLKFNILTEFITFLIVSIGAVYWSYGMYKKCF